MALKEVKTLDELRARALARGATVSLGNSRFNTTGERLRPEPKPAPLPEPKPEPVPPPAAAPALDLAPLIDTLVRGQQSMLEAVAQLVQAERAEVQEVRPVPEAFDVKRDDQGLISRIVPVYKGA